MDTLKYFFLLTVHTLIFISICNCENHSLDWWQTDIIYQIYPRSFKDSNGDGIGDLKGVTEKLSYIKDLGIGAIWFSPIYLSPMVDFGYDIANFKEIDPIFGTMKEFENLLLEAKKIGIKVLLDFVPNHTSNLHEWFKKSVKRIPPYEDFYIWKDGMRVADERRPPNNWISNFGNSAWEWNEERYQYYLHQFAIEQPDLNYRNPVVYEEMKNTIKFWLDKGVDGFRVDVINFIYEDKSFPDEPLSYDPSARGADDYSYLNHTYTQNQEESYELAKDWRTVLDEYSKKTNSTRFFMAETYGSLESIVKFYGTDKNPACHFPFNFIMIYNINKSSNASVIRDELKKWYDAMPEHAWANWVIGNHDNSRAATRFGRYIIDGLHMLQLLLPGTVVTYYGDELGMEDTYIRWDQTLDPPALYAGPDYYEKRTRDPFRTPFQWDDTDNAGFTTNFSSWLPVNPNYWEKNVITESKLSRKLTHLQIFKELAKLRKNIVFQKGDLNFYVLSEWVLAMVRSYSEHTTYIVIVNFGSNLTVANLQKHCTLLPDNLKVVISSVNSIHEIGEILKSDQIKLRPKAAILLSGRD